MTEFDPDRIYAKLIECGHSWVDKEAAADLLEETKKVVLAELTLQFFKESNSRAAAEQAALATTQYREHLNFMNAARKAANRARVDYDSIRALMEMRRTQESTRRAEASIR